MKLVLYFDGGSRGNPGPAGAGVAISDAQGQPVYEAGFYLGRMTNNMAEYGGLLKGLEEVSRRGAKEVAIFADSELVVRQLNGDYRVKNEKLLPLYEAAIQHLRRLERWIIRHVPREQNSRADELANAAMDAGQDVVRLNLAAKAGLPEKLGKPARAEPARKKLPNRQAGEGTGVVVVRCVRPPRGGECPAGCRQGAEFLFEQTVPAGLCLRAAVVILRAVETVRESRKPARAYCPGEGCGACFSVAPA